MFLKEQIDGPVTTEYDRFGSEKIAHGLGDLLVGLGLAIHFDDEHQTKDQNYRIGTWVEGSDQKLGYAFGVSRTKEVPDTVEGFILDASYFVVDREYQKVIGKPKTMEFDSSMGASYRANRTVETYDKTEMIFIISMLKKLQREANKRRPANQIDQHIGIALAVNYVDSLAELYPTIPAK